MADYNPKYGKALTELMTWVDTEALPDFESGWPSTRLGMGPTSGLDVDKFEKDVKCILIEKADGDIHTKMTNARDRGGAWVYADIYKWSTETSGLALSEHASKLMNPPAAKREDLIAECIEEWEENCIRLANYGPEHVLADV